MAVALMTVTEFVAEVRSATGHDSDTAVTDAQITAEGNLRYRNFRRWLSQKAPNLYQKTATFSMTSASNQYTKPADFERVVRLEMQMSQGYWEPLNMRPTISMSQGIAVDVTGTYRLTYTTRPEDGYTTLDVPPGGELVILNETAGWVRQRHEEDPSYHMQEAARIKQELQRDIAMRDGAHPRSLLSSVACNWSFHTWYEEGAYLVIQ